MLPHNPPSNDIHLTVYAQKIDPTKPIVRWICVYPDNGSTSASYAIEHLDTESKAILEWLGQNVGRDTDVVMVGQQGAGVPSGDKNLARWNKKSGILDLADNNWQVGGSAIKKATSTTQKAKAQTMTGAKHGVAALLGKANAQSVVHDTTVQKFKVTSQGHVILDANPVTPEQKHDTDQEPQQETKGSDEPLQSVVLSVNPAHNSDAGEPTETKQSDALLFGGDDETYEDLGLDPVQLEGNSSGESKVPDEAKPAAGPSMGSQLASGVMAAGTALGKGVTAAGTAIMNSLPSGTGVVGQAASAAAAAASASSPGAGYGPSGIDDLMTKKTPAQLEGDNYTVTPETGKEADETQPMPSAPPELSGTGTQTDPVEFAQPVPSAPPMPPPPYPGPPAPSGANPTPQNTPSVGTQTDEPMQPAQDPTAPIPEPDPDEPAVDGFAGMGSAGGPYAWKWSPYAGMTFGRGETVRVLLASADMPLQQEQRRMAAYYYAMFNRTLHYDTSQPIPGPPKDDHERRELLALVGALNEFQKRDPTQVLEFLGQMVEGVQEMGMFQQDMTEATRDLSNGVLGKRGRDSSIPQLTVR
jgi:hypothetical protein